MEKKLSEIIEKKSIRPILSSKSAFSFNEGPKFLDKQVHQIENQISLYSLLLLILQKLGVYTLK